MLDWDHCNVLSGWGIYAYLQHLTSVRWYIKNSHGHISEFIRSSLMLSLSMFIVFTCLLYFCKICLYALLTYYNTASGILDTSQIYIYSTPNQSLSKKTRLKISPQCTYKCTHTNSYLCYNVIYIYCNIHWFIRHRGVLLLLFKG